MQKIKFKLSKEEIISLMWAMEISCKQGTTKGLDHLAAIAVLRKLYIKLLGRNATLKIKNNCISFTIIEIWALIVQVQTVGHLLGTYEQVLINTIRGHAHQSTS